VPFLVLSILIVATLASLSVVASLRMAATSPAVGAPPTAPMQRIAQQSLMGAGILAACAVFLVVMEGPASLQADRGIRLLTKLVAFAAFISATLPVAIATKRAAAGRLVIDERDQVIIERAPRAQSVVLLVMVVGGALALTEAFWSAGAVPVMWIGVLMWASLIGYGLALPVGLLLGYRRS